MLDKPKKSNKSRFSVDIGKELKIIVFGYSGVSPLHNLKLRLAFALVEI